MKRKIFIIVSTILLASTICYSYSRDWSTSTPIDHTLNREWPEWIRKTKTDIGERLSDMFYGFTSGETDIGVKSLQFRDQGSDPSAISDVIQFYGKSVGGKTELFWKDQDGNAIQLTNAGTLSIPAASQQVPAGAVEAYAGSSTPSGWLLCDGSAVSRTTYAALFTAIGTQYGVGDGATTFNLPSMAGKGVMGRNASDTNFDVLGETGGESLHTMTIAELVPHTHTIPTRNSNGYGTTVQNSDAQNQTENPNSGSTGGGTPFNVLDPYITLNWIIKT